MSEINTHYVKGGYATSDEVVLETTPKTRLVFDPGLHAGGVRGRLIRQKIGPDQKWSSINEVNFKTLPADCGVAVDLGTVATQLLYEKLSELYEVQASGIKPGDKAYVVAEKDAVIVVNDDTVKDVVAQLLGKGYSTAFWERLADEDPNLATRLAAAQIQLDRVRAVEEFAAALPVETGEGFWQGFFEAHPWMIEVAYPTQVFYLRGETYVGGKSIEGRNGRGGVATDFLVMDASTQSFGVVEIKTPRKDLVGPRYRGKDDAEAENHTYSMSAELSGGLVQLRNQLSVAVDYFEGTLRRADVDINRIHPQGILIIGRYDQLTDSQQASFDHFRHALVTTTVITFDELLRRIAALFEIEVNAREG